MRVSSDSAQSRSFVSWEWGRANQTTYCVAIMKCEDESPYSVWCVGLQPWHMIQSSAGLFDT